MHAHRSITLKLLLLALCIHSTWADCFEGTSVGVKVTGSCRGEKTTLFVKDEGLTVKFDSERVGSTTTSQMALKIGECDAGALLTIGEDGTKTFGFPDGPSLVLPMTASVGKSSIKLMGAKSNSHTVTCEPKFKKVKVGFALDVEISFKTSVPSFYATFKDASIYKADSSGALGPVAITLIVLGVVSIVILGGSSIVLPIRLVRFRRELNAKYQTPIPAPVVKVKKVDEAVEEDKDDEDQKGQREDKSLKLVTAIYSPRVVDRPDIEKWALNSRGTTTVETEGILVRTAVGEYEVPNWIVEKYLEGSRYLILREILPMNDARRRIHIYFKGVSDLIFDQSNELLGKLGINWLRGTSISDFRKELKRLRIIAAEVYFFTANRWSHDTASLPWSFNSIAQIGQLYKRTVEIAFTYEPPTYDQLVFMRRELKKEKSKGPQSRMPEKDIRIVEHLIKMCSDRENAKSQAPNEALIEFIEGIQKQLRESKY